uniref:Uncharacterized protein n=1 Tax=Ignisphaera aggregans TaxID=334771 RepID=A0A7J3Z6A5_9CREN
MFLLYRVLGIVGDLYVILKTVVKGLGFLEKGFIVEWIDPVIRQEGFYWCGNGFCGIVVL